MQPNPACKSVKGLSVASLVLSILGLAFCLIGFACMGMINEYVEEHSEEIALATVEALEDSSATIEINGRSISSSSVDYASIARALERSGNEELAVFSSFLYAMSEGDVLSALELLGETDASALVDAKNEIARLTDSEISAMAAAIDGVTASELRELRSAMRDIDDEDIYKLCSYLKGKTVSDVVEDTTSLLLVVMYILLACIALSCLITLIAAVLGMRNAFKPENLGAAFVWSIIGAVAAFFAGGFVRMVVLIILAVNINSARKPQPPVYPTANYPGGGNPNVVYGQPGYMPPTGQYSNYTPPAGYPQGTTQQAPSSLEYPNALR